MAELTQEQLSFLDVHRIPFGSLFDASGMGRAAYQKAMEKDGRHFAFGVSRCKRGHHSIRTRAGHCIQCNHAAIAIVFREDAGAYIYIAASRGARLIKVGLTTNLPDRVRNINIERWAHRSDWQMLAFADCPQAGLIERSVHNRLSLWATSCEYTQGGRRHRSYEVFKCNFADARDAMLSTMPRGTRLNMFDEVSASTNFNFRES
jgi:hypothetical protein